MVLLKEGRIKEINSIIENLSVKHDFNFPKTSVADVANSLNISIKVAKFSEDDIAGLIDYGSNEQKPLIFVKEDDNLKKQNFTIAHEIGHLLLHKPNEGRFKIDKYDFSNHSIEATEETEANYFAAELLVPEHKLKEIMFRVNMNEWNLINFCSEYFNVSKSVIVNRLKWIQAQK